MFTLWSDGDILLFLIGKMTRGNQSILWALDTGGGVHSMFVFMYDFASVAVGLLKELGVDFQHDLSITVRRCRLNNTSG